MGVLGVWWWLPLAITTMGVDPKDTRQDNILSRLWCIFFGLLAKVGLSTGDQTAVGWKMYRIASSKEDLGRRTFWLQRHTAGWIGEKRSSISFAVVLGNAHYYIRTRMPYNLRTGNACDLSLRSPQLRVRLLENSFFNKAVHQTADR